MHAHAANLTLGQQHLVDDMDNAVGLLDVSDRHGRCVAGLILYHYLAVLRRERQRAAADGLDRMRAASISHHLGDGAAQCIGANDVASQDFGKLVFAFRLEKRVNRAGGQGVKGAVDGRQHRERPFALQRFDQSCRLDSGDQGGVILGIHSIFDDVLVLEHRRTADLGVGGMGQGGAGEQEGSNGDLARSGHGSLR